MSTPPIKVAIIAADQFTATLRRFRGAVDSTTGPLAGFSGKFKQWGQILDTSKLAPVAQKINGLARSLALGGVAAGVGLYAMVRSTAKAGDELFSTSRMLGLSVESLQEFRYAAKLSNVEAGEFDGAVRKFGVNAAKAFAGVKGDATSAFGALGVSLKDNHGKLKTTEQLFLETTDAIASLPDPLMRNRVAVALFGKSGAIMTKMMGEGAEGMNKLRKQARDLGIVMSGTAAESGDRFNDTFDTMTAVFIGLRNAIGNKFLPIFTDLVKKLTVFLVQHRPEIEAFFKRMAEELPAKLQFLRQAFLDVWGVIRPFVQVFGQIVKAFGVGPILIGALALIISVNLVTAIGTLTGALMTLNAAFLLSPIGWITLAIAALGVAVFATYVHYKNLRDITSKPITVATQSEALTNLSSLYSEEGQKKNPTFTSPAILKAEEEVKNQGIELPQDLKEKINYVFNETATRTGAQTWSGGKFAASSVAPGVTSSTPGQAASDEDMAAAVRRARHGGYTEAPKKQDAQLLVTFQNPPPGTRANIQKTEGFDTDIDMGLQGASY